MDFWPYDSPMDQSGGSGERDQRIGQHTYTEPVRDKADECACVLNFEYRAQRSALLCVGRLHKVTHATCVRERQKREWLKRTPSNSA